jgi:hypothetical protein
MRHGFAYASPYHLARGSACAYHRRGWTALLRHSLVHLIPVRVNNSTAQPEGLAALWF